jgi:hypothetical protein
MGRTVVAAVTDGNGVVSAAGELALPGPLRHVVGLHGWHPAWPATAGPHLNGPGRGCGGWLLLRARRLGGLGRFGEPGVQPFPDLVRSVGTAAPFGAGDHYPGGGDPCQAGQSQHLPPAHLLRLDHGRRKHLP